MGKVRGQDVVISLSDDLYPVACARSVTFELSNEVIETSITGSGNFRTFKQGAIEWGGTIEGLTQLVEVPGPELISIDTIYNWIINGITGRIRWYEEDTTGTRFEYKDGEIMFVTASETSSFDNMVTFNVTFKGIGPVTIVTGII
jgi:predicted secreted protein